MRVILIKNLESFYYVTSHIFSISVGFFFISAPYQPMNASLSSVEQTTATIELMAGEGIFDEYVVVISSSTDSCGAEQPVFTLPREACPEIFLNDLPPDTDFTAQVYTRTGEGAFSQESEKIGKDH